MSRNLLCQLDKQMFANGTPSTGFPTPEEVAQTSILFDKDGGKYRALAQ